MYALWSEICWSTFKYFIILIVSTCYILCISWIIKCLIQFLTFIGMCIANILAEYNQQDATFHNLFISVRCSTCFRRFFRPSSGAQNKYLTLYVQFWAADDGRKNRLKHVERRTEINKSWNVASCWLYSANINLTYAEDKAHGWNCKLHKTESLMLKQQTWTNKSRVIAVIPNGTTLICSVFTLHDHLQNCVFSLVASVATRDAKVQTARVESCNLSKLNVNSRG